MFEILAAENTEFKPRNQKSEIRKVTFSNLGFAFSIGFRFRFRVSPLFPAEPLERQQKRDDSPGRHDTDAPGDGNKPLTFQHDFAKSIVELRQRESLNKRLHGVREALRAKENTGH